MIDHSDLLSAEEWTTWFKIRTDDRLGARVSSGDVGAHVRPLVSPPAWVWAVPPLSCGSGRGPDRIAWPVECFRTATKRAGGGARRRGWGLPAGERGVDLAPDVPVLPLCVGESGEWRVGLDRRSDSGHIYWTTSTTFMTAGRGLAKKVSRDPAWTVRQPAEMAASGLPRRALAVPVGIGGWL